MLKRTVKAAAALCRRPRRTRVRRPQPVRLLRRLRLCDRRRGAAGRLKFQSRSLLLHLQTRGDEAVSGDVAPGRLIAKVKIKKPRLQAAA